MQKKKILVVTDSPAITTGFSRVGIEITKKLASTNKYNIETLAWFHPFSEDGKPVDIKYPHVLHFTDYRDDSDKYGHKSARAVVEAFRPDYILSVGDHWMVDHISQYRDLGYRWASYCFKDDTCAMTAEGEKLIKDLKIGDRVLSIDMFGIPSYKKIISTYRRKYIGPLVCIKSNHADFAITPDHNVLIERAKIKGQYKFVKAIDLYKRLKGAVGSVSFPRFKEVNGIVRDLFYAFKYVPSDFDIIIEERDLDKFYLFDISKKPRHHQRPYTYTLKICDALKKEDEFVKTCLLCDKMPIIRGKVKDRSEFPVILNTNLFLELAGWVISEGHLSSVLGSNRIIIAQSEINNREISHYKELKELLDSIGLNHRPQKVGFSIAGGPIVEIMKMFGWRSGDKKIPNWIFKLDASHLKHLFKTLMLGDGNRQGSRYGSISEQLKRDVARLAMHIGYGGLSDKYGVGIRKSYNKTSLSGSQMFLEDCSGVVYCVSVEDNGTILAGRNGKYQYIGQCPIDGIPYPSAWKYITRLMDVPVTFTEFGKKAIQDKDPFLNVLVVPHGVDTKVFKRLPRNEVEHFKQEALPQLVNKFVVGTGGRNQPRKNYPAIFEAYAKFCADKQDTVMYCHVAEQDPVGWNLADLADRFGLRGKVVIPAMQACLGVPNEILNKVYNCFDIGIYPYCRGAWELIPAENISCGVPILFTNYGPVPEYAAGCGEAINVKNFVTSTHFNLMDAYVDVDDMVAKMNKLYYNPELRAQYGAAGIERAKQLDWSLVTEPWIKIFDMLDNQA